MPGSSSRTVELTTTPAPGRHAADRSKGHRIGLPGVLAQGSGALVLIVLCVTMFFPLLWMVLTSIRPGNSVFSGPFWPTKFTFSAYPLAWKQIDFGAHFLNSVVITTVSVAVVVSLASIAGYAFAKLEFRFKQVIFLALLSTLMMPATALIIPLFQQVKALGLVDSRYGLILVYIGTSLPFATFLMRAFFETLPSELVAAARIDGASEFRVFLQVMLPLARPGLATVVIFQFLHTWNEFLYANTIIQSPANLPLQPMLFSLVGEYSSNWPALCAALTMSVVPIIIVYVRMQKQFVAGMTMGAVKD